MVNINEIIKATTTQRSTVRINIPVKITVDEEDYALVEETYGNKNMQPIFQKIIDDSMTEMSTLARKQKLNVPIKETITHEVRGEWKEDIALNKVERKREGVSAYAAVMRLLSSRPGQRYKVKSIAEELQEEPPRVFNALYKLEIEGKVDREKTEHGVLWHFVEDKELAATLPSSYEQFGNQTT